MCNVYIHMHAQSFHTYVWHQTHSLALQQCKAKLACWINARQHYPAFTASQLQTSTKSLSSMCPLLSAWAQLTTLYTVWVTLVLFLSPVNHFDISIAIKSYKNVINTWLYIENSINASFMFIIFDVFLSLVFCSSRWWKKNTCGNHSGGSAPPPTQNRLNWRLASGRSLPKERPFFLRFFI